MTIYITNATVCEISNRIQMVNEDKPGALDDKAFFICTAEIFPIAAIGQPDKLSTDKLLHTLMTIKKMF